MKCFLTTDSSQFDPFQILDSVIQLFHDSKEKIRNLALEAIATFASIGFRNKILEIMFHNNVEKDICDMVNARFDYGMYPVLNQEGAIEIPYQDQYQYEVDSVAQSMANQSQGPQYHENSRRKQSIGGNSSASYQGKGRGNSSGRKIVVATANATNQQLVSHHDEIMQQAYMQSKRTASANTYEIDPSQGDPNFMHGQGNFSYSVGGGTNHKNRSYVPQFDDMMFPPTDLNGSNFLPQL